MDSSVNGFSILAYFCSNVLEKKDMKGIQHGTSLRRPHIRCVISTAHFQAIQSEEARIIQDTLEMQKCCFELAHVGSFCHEQGVHQQYFFFPKKECK